MPHIFTSSRLTKGNSIFPITIKIDNDYLYYDKGFLLGRSQIVVPIASIGSIAMVNKVVFADLVIETRGGRVFYLNGFSRSDAKKIFNLLIHKKRKIY